MSHDYPLVLSEAVGNKANEQDKRHHEHAENCVRNDLHEIIEFVHLVTPLCHRPVASA